jgi:hypothetical protein
MIEEVMQSLPRKPVNWFLFLALIIATLLPAHYHLHHDDMAKSFIHSHVIDLHLIADQFGSKHHEFDTTSFTAVPDDAVNMKTPLVQYIIIVVLLFIIPGLHKQLHIYHKYMARGLSRISPHFIPLLRAPPLS